MAVEGILLEDEAGRCPEPLQTHMTLEETA